jgi:glycosyltransferase involved in cell wall biosynthesis
MSLRILISGTTGDSMPPPYAGIPKVSLLYARTWKKMGQTVGVTWVYKPDNADDEGAGADYFFEYKGKPTKFKKALFLIQYFFKNPSLYIFLFKKYWNIYPRFSKETFLYSSYGVWVDGVIATFKPDIILCQAALIKAFMVSEVAKRRKIPVVYNTYAEVHDLKMGVNKHLDEAGRTKYWSYFMKLPEMVIGMDNCSVGPLMYLPPEKVKVFYDTCDWDAYQVKLPDTKDERRDELGLPRDRFLVGMVGAFHYRKGHDHLIKAISILHTQGLNVGAVIVGGNVGKEKWVDLATQEGVADKVYFFQNLSEFQLVRLHKTLDAYANLSNSTRSCGLDLALLGAMAGGLPIVVYDNGALPGAVPHGANGLVVKTNNIEAVAEAIKKLYNLPREKLAAMGRESAAVAKKTDINLTSEIKLGWFNEIVENYRGGDTH